MPKSSVEQYQQFQQYTNYIDTSDVMLGFYKHEEGSGLQKYFLMIQQWLSMQAENPQNNHPLVIEGDGGVGKKTLLVKWYQYHQNIKPKNKRDLTILHFATTGGNNSNYFYAIYRILIKLREELNIGQKVQLHQQKIRKYFSYWLDVCNQRIQNQSFQNVDTVYEKIILVFEGIDYFMDRGSGKQGNIAFWLPKYFPKNVKVIVTADGQSQSMRYFNKLSCQKVVIPSDPNLVRDMIRWQNQKQLCVKGNIKEKLFSTLSYIIKNTEVTSLFVKSYLSCLLPQKVQGVDLKEQSLNFIQKTLQKVDHDKVKQLKSIQSLFDYLLQFWGGKLLQSQQKFKELIGILISTQKGLTRFQIISITGISQQQLKLFITLFRSFLMNFKELWMIKNDCFKKAINNKYQFVYAELSQKIAQSLKKTPNSVRKLEQQTFHLYTAGNYFKLKQVISDIQNFLLLFNPYTKYDLCKYWQKLEEKSFDPVIQYNKAIQGFQMHYHPTSDDLFRIITQISRFLKQFSDFQTYYTPKFRHPKIVGNKSQLRDIGILGQFKNLQMCFESGMQQNSKPQQKKYSIDQNQNGGQNDQQKKLKKKIKQMYDKIQQGKHIKKVNKIQSDGKDPVITTKNEKKKKQKILTVQQLNVQVKSNQENFRKYYYQAVKPFLQKFCFDGSKQSTHSEHHRSEEVDDSDKQQTETDNLVAKIKSIEKQKEKEKSKFEELPDLKSLYVKAVEQQFQLNQKPPTNYYYKRWIWMQFPWVCMTMKCDYSDRLRKCFTSPTSYMSVSQQRQFTLQALKIALEAKRKKQAILQKSQEPSQMKKKQTLAQLSVGSRYLNKQNENGTIVDTSNLTFKSKSKKKLQQLAYSTNSFLSLNNLEKEMQSININLRQTNKQNSRLSPHNDSKNSLFITSEDKTFDEYSSLLHSMNKRKKKQIFNQSDLDLTNKSRQQGLLPRIKQNVNKQMISQLEELQKNNAVMRKQVDNYLYKNKALAKKLKQLKIIQQNNNNQVKNQKKISQTKKKISQIQSKIQRVKNQYAYSLLQHQRLHVLIKICQQNKTQNQQAIPDLVLECNNLKKMINLEKFSINQLNKKIEQIKKLTKKFLQNCYQKVKNQTILNQQIQQTFKNREYFNEQVQKYDEMILEQVQEKRRVLNERAKSIHQKTEEQKNIQKYRMSNYHQQQQNYQKIYNKIIQYLQIDSENYKQDPKYIKLLQGLQKKKELEAIIEQRKMQVEQLQKKLSNERRDLETLAKAEEDVEERKKKRQQIQQKYENQIQMGESEEILMKKLHQKKRTLKKVTDVRLSCLGMLNTWYSKIGLPEQTQLIITQQFLEKLEKAKALSS